LNARGGFNVPPGRYDRPTIVNRERLRCVADALGRADVRLLWGSFAAARDIAEAGDFVYCDPPYAPVSRTSSFTSYTAGGFSNDDQRQVQAFVIDLAERGCRVVLSNSAAPTVERMYARDERARAAGLRVRRVLARRSINSDAAARGAVRELLVSNVAPASPAHGRGPQHGSSPAPRLRTYRD
jgi:DNA adenine methylase